MKIYGLEFLKVSKKNQYLNPKNWSWKPVHKNWLINPKQFRIKKDFEIFNKNKLHKGYVLVIAPKDVQTGALLQELRKQNKSYVYINWDQFTLHGGLHYNLNTEERFLQQGSTKISLDHVRTVYFLTPDIVESQWDVSNYFNISEKLYINRWAESLLSIYGILNKAKWYPTCPTQLYGLSQRKFSELHLAKKMGMKVPDTIFTSSPTDAKKFLIEHKTCVLREYGRRHFVNNKNQFKFIEIKAVSSDSKKLNQIRSAPVVFQEYIEKEFEIRAVVINNKVLTCKIESQKSKNSKMDWRGQEGVAPFSAFKLPRNIEQKLIRFAKHQGFGFATFDLIKSKSGQFYFLEMNRPGNWFFIEALAGLEIRKNLARVL